jgi:hypothetical protein
MPPATLRVAALLLAGSLMGLAAGCHCSQGQDAPEPASGAAEASPGPPDAVAKLPPVGPPGPPDAGPSRADVRAAMLSVYYHGDRERPEELEASFLPRTEAAEILAEDARRSSFGESRRRRAVRKLVMGGLVLRDDGKPDHRYRDALLILLERPGRPGAEVLSEIDGAIERVVVEFHEPVPSPTSGELPADLAQEIGEGVAEYLDSGGGAIRGCPSVTESLAESIDGSQATSTCAHSDPNWTSDLVWVEATVSVQRSVSEVAEALDPQNWDAWDQVENEPCSLWFEKIDVVEPPDWEAKSCPPAPGFDWSGYVWEKFYVDWALGSTEFRNVLQVVSDRDPDVDPSRHRFDFCLEDFRGGDVGGDASGTIAVDEGASHVAQGSNGWVNLTAEKRISFRGWADDAGMKVAAEYALLNMGDAHAEQACCRPPPPPACVTP